MFVSSQVLPSPLARRLAAQPSALAKTPRQPFERSVQSG